MTRHIRGRDAIANPTEDRLEFSLSSLKELSLFAEAKVIRGGRSMDPRTARDADMDLLVLEGIPTINFGRGVPDPTPGGARGMMSQEPPRNRAERRIRKASRPKLARVSRTRPDLRKFVALSGGAMGKMADEEDRYPAPSGASIVDRYEVEQFVQSMSSKVNDILGPRPETMKQLLENLNTLVDLTNGIGPDGKPSESGSYRNFSMLPVYFIAQTQDALSKAVGGRFNGPDTTPSMQDLGIYYALSSEILDNPEAFRDVSLLVMPTNMPDVMPSDGPSGSHSILPIYYEATRTQPRTTRSVNSYGATYDILPSSVVSSAGVRDYTGESINIIPKTTNAKITSIVSFPIHGHGSNQAARFRGVDVATGKHTISFSSPAAEPQIESFRRILEDYEKALATVENIKTPFPLIDTTIVAVASSMLNEARELSRRAEQALAENPNSSAKLIGQLNDEAQSLIETAEQALAMMTALHEIGHHMDSIGEYKSSSAYDTASSTTSSGLNSMYEYKRDLAALEVLARGEDSPYLYDFSEAMARDLMRRSLKKVLGDYVVLSTMSEGVSALAELSKKLQGVDAILDQVSRSSDGSVRWLQMIMDGRTTTLRDAMQYPMQSGIMKPNMGMSPAEVEAMAKQAIDLIREATPAYSVAEEHRIVGEVPRVLRFAMDNQALSKLLEGASDQSRAYVTVAAARAYRDMMAQAINRASISMTDVANKSRENIREYELLVPWLNEQSIDMDGYRKGWRTLISDLIKGNPDAVDEFMNISARIHQEDGWLDAEGNFNRRNYVRSVLKKSTGRNKTWSPGSMMTMVAINRAINKHGYEGWKELSEDEARIAAGAASAISEYAGQADYTLSLPTPKFQQTSNAETYAELHAAIVSQMESLLSKLTQEEYDIMRKLHDQMMAEANRLRNQLENRSSSGGEGAR